MGSFASLTMTANLHRRMVAGRTDLVVVGGGPAGLSTALHFVHHAPALAGRIVVLEKGRYPRDKYCAGAIGGRALRLLERIGVRVPVPSLPIHAVSLRAAGEERVLREPDMGIVVRRIEFDHALAREAIRRGIEVRDGVAVEGVEVGVDGVRVRLASDAAVEACAVVGADGVAGVVRRAAGFGRGRLRAQAVELDTERVAGDLPSDTIRFDFATGDLNGYAWDFPTLVEGRELMCRGVYRIVGSDAARASDGSERSSGDDVRARLAGFLAKKGLDIGRYRVKQFAERGFEPGQPVSKPRVLLVGEAAGIDIATGEGIAQAIQYGSLAGRYLASAFERGAFGFSDWLARVRAHQVGWQLRQRLWFCERFYGAHRQLMERLLLASPSGLRLGVRQFAGKPLGATHFARAITEVTPQMARLGPANVLRALRGSH
jgi:flavin-dependent dehydrogenase